MLTLKYGSVRRKFQQENYNGFIWNTIFQESGAIIQNILSLQSTLLFHQCLRVQMNMYWAKKDLLVGYCSLIA